MEVNVYLRSKRLGKTQMLKINRQTDYAIRVVLALAKKGENARLSSADIQQDMLIPKSFMSRIVAHLAHHRHLDATPLRTHRAIGLERAVILTLYLHTLREEDWALERVHDIFERDL